MTPSPNAEPAVVGEDLGPVRLLEDLVPGAVVDDELDVREAAARHVGLGELAGALLAAERVVSPHEDEQRHVAVELLASSEGLGYLMVWGRQLFQLDLVIMAMIVVGGVTRLTHSGLSITEWQPIVGTLPPLSAPVRSRRGCSRAVRCCWR